MGADRIIETSDGGYDYSKHYQPKSDTNPINAEPINRSDPSLEGPEYVLPSTEPQQHKTSLIEQPVINYPFGYV